MINIYIFLLTVILIIFMNFVKLEKTTMLTGFIVGGVMYYFIIPILVSYFENAISYRRNVEKNFFWLSKTNSDIVSTVNQLFIYFLLTIVFYYAFTMFKKSNYNYIMNEKAILQFVSFVGYFSFCVGSISLLFFFYSLGGISNALGISESVRSFSGSLTDFVSYKVSLLIVPARLITVAPVCFIYLYSKEKKKLSLALMILGFIFSSAFLLFNSGRAPILTFILYFCYPIFNQKIKYSWSIVMLLAVFLLPLLDLFDAIFAFFSTNTFIVRETDYVSLLRQFSYPFRNAIYSNELVEWTGIRMGKDFVLDILSFIPGINFELSYEPTSEFFQGSEWKVLGGIPNDIFTYSKLQFGSVGMWIMPAVLAKIFSSIDMRLCSVTQVAENRFAYFKTILTVDSFMLVASADFQPILRKYIYVFVIITILIGFRKEKKREIS